MGDSSKKPYSDQEKMLLMTLIDKYKFVLENKKTDSSSIRKKQDIWVQITELYNSNNVVPRKTQQLKKLWDNLKQRLVALV